MEGNELLKKAYSDYRDKFLGYDDVPTFEEFKFDILSNGPLSDLMGITLTTKQITYKNETSELN